MRAFRPHVLFTAVVAAAVATSHTRSAAAQPARASTPPAARSVTGALPPIPHDEYAERRRALAALLPDSVGVIVVFGAGEPEEDYLRFEQAPDFRYLTGFVEPEAALVLVRRGPGAEAWDGTLFVQPNDPAREVWTGRRAGVAGARAATGLSARRAAELRPTLDSLARAAAAAGHGVAVVGRLGGAPTALPADAQLVAALQREHPTLRVVPANGAMRRLRAQKRPAELARVRRAAEVTVEAQRAAMGLVAPGVNEYEVQALVEYTFRRRGADRPSFATIVGSGPNSTTLHYNANDRVMRAGEVVVMDIGASWDGYAADVTRTVPVSGRFTPAQRAIYQLVRDAQAAAERAAVTGAPWSAPVDSAQRTIARGLARLGLTEGEGATYDCGPAGSGPVRQCPQWSLYYMHGLGHGIGLDVHDPEQAIAGPSAGGTMPVIAEGSAFTLEPGVYVRARLLDDVVPDTPRNRQLADRIRDAVARHADVGVRIEDDYIVTARGVEWISRAPRELDEVEAAMRAGRASRTASGAR
jgi:Xaa-Pro aminopeptidase